MKKEIDLIMINKVQLTRHCFVKFSKYFRNGVIFFFNAIYSFIVFFRIFSLFIFLTVTDLRSNLRISISLEAPN